MPAHGKGVRNPPPGDKARLENVPPEAQVKSTARPKPGPKGHPVTGTATPSSPQAAARQGEEQAKRPRS